MFSHAAHNRYVIVYFPPGPQLPSQPLESAATNFAAWLVNRGTISVSSLPKTVTDSVATAS